MPTVRKKVTAWAVRHPVHGASVRTTKCSPNNQPPGWSHVTDLDALVVGTDGQVYTPNFHSLAAGTNFNNGDITMSAGETLNGTVAFELPDGVKVASIKWTPTAGFASVHGTWLTPAGLSA